MSRRAGFTLLEVLTTIVVIGILAIMVIPAIGVIRSKAETGGCITNLKSLYTAGVSYLTEHDQQWPQLGTKDMKSKEWAEQWFRTFEPYGIGRKGWVCPSIQRQSKNPDLEKAPRVDYLATAFGPKRRQAYEWPNHPWFIENGNMHGDGNLVMFTTGQIKTLTEIQRDTQVQRR